MPQAILKLLLLLALAVAVPAQGIAAVTAGFCMAMGHHQGHGARTLAHVHGTDGHNHAAMEAAQPERGADSPKSDKPSGNSQCPPCVSCCAVAAIAQKPHIGLPDAPPATAIAVLHAAFAGFLPQRLDRPPLAL